MLKLFSIYKVGTIEVLAYIMLCNIYGVFKIIDFKGKLILTQWRDLYISYVHFTFVNEFY